MNATSGVRRLTVQQPERVDLAGPADLRLHAQVAPARLQRKADVQRPAAGLDRNTPFTWRHAPVADVQRLQGFLDRSTARSVGLRLLSSSHSFWCSRPAGGRSGGGLKGRLFLWRSRDGQHNPDRGGSDARVGDARCRGAARRSPSAATRCALFIDHPDGVTLELCEQVTRALPDLRERYALEVSSPGIERPLTKPDHFRRYLGRRARVRTRGEVEGHKTFTGELVGASDAEVTIAADSGVIAIPYAEIHRSNLVEE